MNRFGNTADGADDERFAPSDDEEEQGAQNGSGNR